MAGRSIVATKYYILIHVYNTVNIKQVWRYHKLYTT